MNSYSSCPDVAYLNCHSTFSEIKKTKRWLCPQRITEEKQHVDYVFALKKSSQICIFSSEVTLFSQISTEVKKEQSTPQEVWKSGSSTQTSQKKEKSRQNRPQRNFKRVLPGSQVPQESGHRSANAAHSINIGQNSLDYFFPSKYGTTKKPPIPPARLHNPS